ncbi:hypothetical protein [Winogradskyella wichelsiae]|uniref:hypothetical protein n=1 Tax=Winogradskyella wichelsiae TaxID=2697007 RepID=UPI0015C9A756|nr:hypothetical protein [Winogradskyella wichelsiae]
MKNKRLKNYLKIGILLLGIPILFFTCEKGEQKQELESNFKTVQVNDAISFLNLNSQNLANRNSNESYLISVSDDIVQEEITDSNELLTILPATTIYDHHYSRILY